MIYTFYHITKNENKNSILKNGLVPCIGENVRKCRDIKEKVSKDPRISLCKYNEIENWKNALYKNIQWEDLAIFEVKINSQDYIIKHRTWSNGIEYAVWTKIPQNCITIFSYN